MNDLQNDIKGCQVLSTLEFRMGPSIFLSEVIFRYGAPWLLALCALGLSGIALCILVDYRWLLAVLFLIFVLAPTLLVFIYYYFGLRREAYVNTVLHSITANDAGLIFHLKFPANSSRKDEGAGDVQDNVTDNVTDNGVDNGVENGSIARDEFFGYDVMLPMRTGMKSVTIPLRAPAKGSLWIPRSAFGSDDDMASFLKYIDGHLEQSE